VAKERCMLYVDGYNFYYAVKRNPSVTPLYLGWCDFRALALKHLVPAGGTLEGIKYFTAPVGRYGAAGGALGGEAARQSVWLEALTAAIPDVEIIEGYYAGDPGSPRSRKEKETDVQLAISVVIDACRDRYDRALLLTGDRDQRPTVRAVAEEFHKRADVWLSPSQMAGSWKFSAAHEGVQIRQITRQMLQHCRLPETIAANDGRTIEAPKIWRAPR